jgi:hypothetical protein
MPTSPLVSALGGFSALEFPVGAGQVTAAAAGMPPPTELGTSVPVCTSWSQPYEQLLREFSVTEGSSPGTHGLWLVWPRNLGEFPGTVVRPRPSPFGRLLELCVEQVLGDGRVSACRAVGQIEDQGQVQRVGSHGQSLV